MVERERRSCLLSPEISGYDEDMETHDRDAELRICYNQHMQGETEKISTISSSASESFPASYGSAILIFMITAAGAFLRFHQLSHNSLWLDEGATYELSRLSLLGIWNSMTTGEFNPPLFYWIEHLMLCLGKSEFLLRLVPALLGTAAIPLVYLLGRELCDEPAGVLSASIVAFSPFHIFYSQEARAYTTVTFLLACAILCFARAWKSGSACCWAAFGLFSALSFYTHFYSALLIIALILLGLAGELWLRERSIQRIRHFCSGLLLSLLLVLPLLVVAVPVTLRRAAVPPSWGIQGIEALKATLGTIMSQNSAAMVFLAILSIIGIAVLWRKSRMSALIVTLSIAVPLSATALLSHRIPFHPRYLIYLIPLFAIAISCGLSPLFSRQRWIVTALVIVTALLQLSPLKEYYSKTSKDDWRGVVRQLGLNRGSGDIYVFVPGYVSLPFLFYYEGPEQDIVKMDSYGDSDFEALVSLRKGKRLFFIVTEDVNAVSGGDNAKSWLAKNAGFCGSRTGIHVFLVQTGSP